MGDTTDSDSTETTTDSENEHEHEQEQDHDCQEHLEYVEYELVENGYDDIFVCRICEDEYRLVYARAFLLDGDDYSLVEEYTDSIEKDLRQLRDNQDDDTDGAEESAEPVAS